MLVDGRNQRSLWIDPADDRVLQVIDQRYLPHRLVVEDLRSVEDVFTAIADMHIRGAPLIGAVAAYGMWFAAREATLSGVEAAAAHLKSSRPTAINLAWAVDRMLVAVRSARTADRGRRARAEADQIVLEEFDRSRRMGEHGLPLLAEIARRKSGPVQVLTHCNAGWLATVDYGTATAPIYMAHDQGIDVHVWVDETRPRNQGMLTAWELGNHGVPHTVIADNTGGQLMREGRVDLVIVGTDRTTRNGDVANKIGTYLKALAARDNGIPFYVAAPSSSIDFSLQSGDDIPIEARDGGEVRRISGRSAGEIVSVEVTPDGSPVLNLAFDVTPARLVTGLITERGVCGADRASLEALFPDLADANG